MLQVWAKPGQRFVVQLLPTVVRLSFLGWKGSLWVTVLGLALKIAASSCCLCSSFTYKRGPEVVFEFQKVKDGYSREQKLLSHPVVPSAPSDCSSLLPVRLRAV